VRYRTEVDAKMALAYREWKDKGEVRAYHHSQCGGWHLTSQQYAGRAPIREMT
jgi:hypothetical protein